MEEQLKNDKYIIPDSLFETLLLDSISQLACIHVASPLLYDTKSMLAWMKCGKNGHL
jgi:hypothetical protein